jgi:aryl-alcohol dehydrogenase-like predicted oxidoreductase
VRYRTLGRSGLAVSEVGLGGGGIGAVWGPTTDSEAIRAVHRAFDLGITFFDVAPDYGDGRAEDVLGRALRGERARAIVATKVHVPAERLGDVPGYARASLAASLERLRMDHVDLLQLHNTVGRERGRPLPTTMTAEDALAAAEAFEELRREGLVRFLGFTAWRVHGPALDRLLRSGRFDTLQTEYNLVNQTALLPAPAGTDILDDAAMEAVGAVSPRYFRYRRVDQARAIPRARAHGLGVIAIRPYLAGFLTDGLDRPLDPDGPMAALLRFPSALAFLRAGGRRTLSQAALAFCLAQPDIATTLVGAKSVAEVEEAARCSGGPCLGPEELGRIPALYEQDFPPDKDTTR